MNQINGENGCFMSQMSQWVMSQWVRSEKNKSFGRNNKIKHYFYLICLLASLLPVHARPISDMKSQLGLFVSSIPGPAATTTCMPRKIAFPDTFQAEPFKPSDNPEVKCCPKVVHISSCTSFKEASWCK